MYFRQRFSNTHMRGIGLVGNNEASSYSHTYIFLHASYAIYRTHDWYPWSVFNPLMILVMSETRALNWNINVICLWIYSRNICPNILWQFEECWMYRDSCQVPNMNDEVHGMKFIPHINLWAIDSPNTTSRQKHLNTSSDSRIVYCPSFIWTGWLISSDSIDLVNAVTTMM